MRFLFPIAILLLSSFSSTTFAWFDETHLAVAKAAGYEKWFNAAGPDIAKLKMGDTEGHNHYVNNPREAIVSVGQVLSQVERYNQIDPQGHLYGAIIASIRDYMDSKRKGQYAEYHLAYCAHYIGDLSQPLHHTLRNAFNVKNHSQADGIVNDEVFNNTARIVVHSVEINSETDLAREIVRVANTALTLGYRLEDENRLLTKDEAYQQLSQSSSLLKAVLKYVRTNFE